MSLRCRVKLTVQGARKVTKRLPKAPAYPSRRLKAKRLLREGVAKMEVRASKVEILLSRPKICMIYHKGEA